MKNTLARKPTRVFLVDDHPLVREGLANLIERQPDLRVCGQAETSAAAVRRRVACGATR